MPLCEWIAMSWMLPCVEVCFNETESWERSILISPSKQHISVIFVKATGKEIRCQLKLATSLAGSHRKGCLVLIWETPAGGRYRQSNEGWRVCEKNVTEKFTLPSAFFFFLHALSACIPTHLQLKVSQVQASRWAVQQKDRYGNTSYPAPHSEPSYKCNQMAT